MKNFKFMRWFGFKEESEKDRSVPVCKISQIKLKDTPPIKAWEIIDKSLILRIPFYWAEEYSAFKMIMEYQIPLEDLHKALKED
jgi:hypothetical protein